MSANTNNAIPDPIEDVQGRSDHRQIAIDKVGICDIRHPIAIKQRDGNYQATVATFGMYVNLPHELKGTHMSRFVELLNSQEQYLDPEAFLALLDDMTRRLKSDNGHIDMRFPFFMSKKAPITRSTSVMDYEVCFSGSRIQGHNQLLIETKVPVTTLCPCSKDISDYGAHNQRSLIAIQVQADEPFAIEELIELAESEGSCQLYGILKRVDEKAVTEKAYENPKFVEDVVRDIATHLNDDDRFSYYRLSSENFESIHNHSAYAYIEHDKRQAG